ncbi:MAG: hypothetical protein Q8888_00050 [Vigna little leaf phytoplasma]|nr:hypothetical protein [Vigna little leaf phytoplasma]
MYKLNFFTEYLVTIFVIFLFEIVTIIMIGICQNYNDIKKSKETLFFLEKKLFAKKIELNSPIVIEDKQEKFQDKLSDINGFKEKKKYSTKQYKDLKKQLKKSSLFELNFSDYITSAEG